MLHSWFSKIAYESYKRIPSSYLEISMQMSLIGFS